MSWENMLGLAFLFAMGLFAATTLWKAHETVERSKDWIEWDWDHEEEV